MISPTRAEEAVLGWARFYTRGLIDETRERRLEELASDCHEQRRRGGEVGASPTAVATSMVARTMAGMPADLLWRRTMRVQEGHTATRRDRSPEMGGRLMGRWIRQNWWIALAALLGAMHVALGVALPFEDRTLGALFGGIVIAVLGLAMLVGIRVRRRNRRMGGMLIALGTLPSMPFFWTIVLPILGAVVFVAALLDIADATAAGDSRAPAIDVPPWREDRLIVAALLLFAAAVVAAVVIATPTAAAALGAPPLALLVGRVAARRLPMPSVASSLGLTMFLAGLAHTVLMLVVTLAADEGAVDLGHPIALATGLIVSLAGALGLILWVGGLVVARNQARPA